MAAPAAASSGERQLTQINAKSEGKKENNKGEQRRRRRCKRSLFFFSGEENKERRRRVGVARRASEFYIKAVLDAARVTEEGAGMV